MQGNIFFFGWEEQVLLFFQSFTNGIWESVAKLFTAIGEELIPIAIVAFIYWCIDKRLGKRIGFTVTLASLSFPMIKNIALRLRPYMVHQGVQCLKPVTAGAAIDDIAAQGYSFPSGHSTISASTYGAIGVYLKRRWAWCLAFLLPLLIGLSRICLGVHYPTDVLAGWALGALCVALTVVMDKVIKRDWVRFAILFVIAVPGLFYCNSDDFFTAFGLLIGFAAGMLFEEKLVNFATTRRPLIMLLRTGIGLLLYLGVNTALKAVLVAIGGTAGPVAYALRVLRYAVCVFLLIGPYPMLFARLDQWLPARKKAV